MTEDSLKELEEIKKMGFNPYPYRFDRTHSIKEIIDKYQNVKPGEKIEDVKITTAGRIRSKRKHGKLSFAHIKDASGEIQVYISFDNVDEKEYELFQKLLGNQYMLSTVKQYASQEKLNMTYLALNLSKYVNGVSKAHMNYSKKIFPGHRSKPEAHLIL